jgi:hypothetical protein
MTVPAAARIIHATVTLAKPRWQWQLTHQADRFNPHNNPLSRVS